MVWQGTNAPARNGTSRVPTEGELPGVAQPGPDHAHEWVIGGHHGRVCNCGVTAVVRVLDGVGAGSARGWIKCAFGGREVVWRPLPGRERGLAKGGAAICVLRTLWCRMRMETHMSWPPVAV
jgi:hypothetical protein